jgi:dGTPase
MIKDLISSSAEGDQIRMSPGMLFIFDSFHTFMFENVYTNMRAKSEEKKVFGILFGIYEYYVKT